MDTVASVEDMDWRVTADAVRGREAEDRNGNSMEEEHSGHWQKVTSTDIHSCSVLKCNTERLAPFIPIT